MTKPPQRDVIRARSFEGPGGGSWFDLLLECGHGHWRRAKRPPTRVQCVPCWRLQFEPAPRPPIVPPEKLLLVSRDELLEIWDALALAVRLGDVGDPSFAAVKALRERVAELLS